MGDDILKAHSETEVHGWYERLATKVSADSKGQGVAEPMSGLFLLQYLGKNKNSLGDTLELDAPEHLKADDSVTDVLAFHRAVFLTEKKGRFKPAPDRWAGLIPRLQSGKWDGNSQVQLEYNSLSDVAPNAFAIANSMRRSPPRSGTSSPHCVAGN